MLDFTCAHYVQVDVDDTTIQVFADLDSSGMVTIVPENSLASSRWLYSCAVRPATNRVLYKITFRPVSFTRSRI